MRICLGTGVKVSATQISASGTLPFEGAKATHLRIYNDGAIAVLVRWGASAASATAADVVVPAKTVLHAVKGAWVDKVSAMTTSVGAADVYFIGYNE